MIHDLKYREREKRK